jgi:hypothetical protein
MNNAIRSRPLDVSLSKAWHGFVGQRGRAFGFMIVGALLAFEVFNYSTTEFALNDVLGNLKFIGIKWATILAIAFCGIDFAGIARLFTPEQGADEPAEVWYLFGAWILAAAMNATLTWWGVSVAIATHTSQGAAVMSSDTIQKVVPVFVAVMVWVIRILIIGTFSLAGERMFTQAERYTRRTVSDSPRPTSLNNQRPIRPTTSTASRPILAPASQFKPQPKPTSYQSQRPDNDYARQEPTYHNLMTTTRQADLHDERS